MGLFADFSGDRTLSDPLRFELAQRATWNSAAVNLLLTVAQIAVGWLSHSQSLIAHGVHSFTDLLSDFLVLLANRQGHHPADQDHPYGHARIETAGTLVLGGSLFAVGLGILGDAASRLQVMVRGSPTPDIEMIALWVALGTVFAKEGLYRYLLSIAKRVNSRLMLANALHTRADAASALVVVAGVSGAVMGWPSLDLVAAMVMGLMVLRLGAEMAWGALRELIDEGLDEQQLASIRDALKTVPNIIDIHELRTRRMSHQALVDLHVLVSPRISVSEGHYIAELARIAILRSNPQVLDVLVHVDPEDDSNFVGGGCTVPVRPVLEKTIRNALAELPAPSALRFHYLAGRVDVELWFKEALAENEINEIGARLASITAENTWLSSAKIVTERTIMEHCVPSLPRIGAPNNTSADC